MSLKGEKVTVTTSAAVLISKGGVASVTKACVVKNPSGGSSIWLGGLDVTISGGTEGFQLETGEIINLDLIDEDVYAIAAGSVPVYILRSQKG